MKPYEVWWEISDFMMIPAPRSRRCKWCGTRLPPGSQVVSIRRWKVFEDAHDYDDGPSLARYYICLPCHAYYECRVASHEDAGRAP